MWEGLAVELAKLSDLRVYPSEWPSSASASEVARKAGVTRQAVLKWRDKPAYFQGLKWLLGQDVAREVAALRDSRPQRRLSSNEQRLADLHVFVKNNWSGPVVSPLDGKRYDSVASYVGHLLEYEREHDCVLAPWEPRSKLSSGKP